MREGKKSGEDDVGCKDVTQTLLLHTDAFPDALTQKRFYTQAPLHTHTDAFTHKFFTHIHTHTRFYTQTLLHTDAFTNRAFTHGRAFTH